MTSKRRPGMFRAAIDEQFKRPEEGKSAEERLRRLKGDAELAPAAPPATIAPRATVAPPATVAPTEPEPLHRATVAPPATVAPSASLRVEPRPGYTSLPNTLLDGVLPL